MLINPYLIRLLGSKAVKLSTVLYMRMRIRGEVDLPHDLLELYRLCRSYRFNLKYLKNVTKAALVKKINTLLKIM